MSCTLSLLNVGNSFSICILKPNIRKKARLLSSGLEGATLWIIMGILTILAILKIILVIALYCENLTDWSHTTTRSVWFLIWFENVLSSSALMDSKY